MKDEGLIGQTGQRRFRLLCEDALEELVRGT
jgi:hypothetical protein